MLTHIFVMIPCFKWAGADSSISRMSKLAAG